MRPRFAWGVAIWLWASGVPAEPFYVNSRGERVILTEAAGRATLRSGAVFRDPRTGGVFWLHRQLIVKLRPGGNAGILARELGLAIRSGPGLDGATWVFRAPDARAVLAAAVAAAQRPEVVWALPDFILPVRLLQRPTDPYYARQWYLHQDTGAHIRAEEAWDVTRGDPRIVVAVLDTGVEPDHPDFDPERILPGYNAVTGGDDTTPHEDAIGSHGTSCAGLIVASADNGEGMSGICPRCSLMDIKAFDGPGASISAGAAAIEHPVREGAWVLSISWVYEAGTQVDLEPFTQAVRAAVNQGRDGQGAVVLFAAGNGGREISPDQPPGLPEVMAVGGTGPDDRVVNYSDFGSNLSVVAPTWTYRPGDPGIFTADTLGDRGHSRQGWYWQSGVAPDYQDEQTDWPEPDEAGNYTAYFSGTSASCPIAAGVVALVFSANPELTGAEARLIVEQTADKVGGVDYDENGHHVRYGYGRVNAGRAVRAARAGLGRGVGEICAENVNCEIGNCARADAQDDQGLCGRFCLEDGDCEPAVEACAPVGEALRICLPACEAHGDCGPGTVCRDGACLAVACAGIEECPQRAICVEGACQGFRGKMLGAIGCASAGGPGSGWALLVLGGVAAASRRRGRRPGRHA